MPVRDRVRAPSGPRSRWSGLRLRWQLARLLPEAGPAAVGAVILIDVVFHLIPAATALATIALIDAATTPAGGPGGGLLLPLLAVAGTLFVAQTCSSVRFTARQSVRARIDRRHRARLMRLALDTPTIERLEDERVQNLITQTRGEEEHWVDGTPGSGAVATLGPLRWIGMISSALVVAAWSWWFVPLLVVPALVTRTIYRRQWLLHFRIWVRGLGHLRRYRYWADQTAAAETAKELRVFGFGGWLLERHQEHVHGHLDDVWLDDQRATRSRWRIFLLAAVPLCVVFVVAGTQAARGERSIALLSAVLGAAWGVFAATGRVGDVLQLEAARPVMAAWDELQRDLGAGASADPEGPHVVTDPGDSTAPDASGTPDDAAPPPALGVAPGDGGTGRSAPTPPTQPTPPLVRFEQVTFRYPGATHAVLDRLELELRPGELLAIVGVNGAGKSTLTKLLAGLYRPESGRITADGHDLREIGPQAWRRRLTVVQQDFVKYQLSLTENVALGKAPPPGTDGWPDRDLARRAAGEAGFGPVADGLPEGWATPLTRSRTGGVDLSGGQWQQVALARGLYATGAGARILVLDEPTAHLDVRTEAELFDRLAGITEGVTTVLISHRLSTVRRADRIVLLDGGRITEQGSHDELMATGGGYARMFLLQAERFRRGYDDRLEEGELR